MSAILTGFDLDARGLVCSCPRCGRRNRLVFEHLGRNFRCSECRSELVLPSSPIDANSAAEFEAVVGKSALPVAVDFWAPWCGPCKMIAPEVAKVALTGQGRWLLVKANTEQLPEIAARFAIRGIPTLAVFHQGRELARQSGAMPAQSIEQFVQRALPTMRPVDPVSSG